LNTGSEASIPLHLPLRRGERRLRIALVGLPGGGKTTLFDAVSSAAPQSGELTGTARVYRECTVQIGLDEASLVELPDVQSFQHLTGDDLVALKYLLWGDERPAVSRHEPTAPPVPFSPPDLIIQVVDASRLQSHLELTLELCRLGRPVVMALNKMDEALKTGLQINLKALEQSLRLPVVPTVALMGQGLPQLFGWAAASARNASCPLPQPASPHIAKSLEPLSAALNREDVHAAFRVPHEWLLLQFAGADGFIERELNEHFPQLLPELLALRDVASIELPRPLAEELHADQHHRAATLVESAMRMGTPGAQGWRYWLDELFLHPQWGLIGSLAVFAAVLFVVFEISGWIDSMTTVQLVEAFADWKPESTGGVVGRAVLDGLIGLTGIVVPYMIPLVMLLVSLEQTGLMQRIAFVVDRGFHRIGLHGGVALPFLLGLGCNVPAISGAARLTSGRERVIAAVLITFVPCSARSAIILAIAGKYLGVAGVISMFALSLVVIGVAGHVLSRGNLELGPGRVPEIPAYALPNWRGLLVETWNRTSDIITIVTPLLVGGSVLLALLGHFGADAMVNALLTPITVWWLGLPLALGVPILFGVLRKELSLLMIYQALGTQELGTVLAPVQMFVLLAFISFYVPCVSTFAVMLKTIGRRDALFSVVLSVGIALLVAGLLRFTGSALTVAGI
jgi:ferrous iron transport protein B